MRYEYKVLTLKRNMWSGKPEATDGPAQDELNGLGTQGWKMVSAVPYGSWTQIFMMREK